MTRPLPTLALAAALWTGSAGGGDPASADGATPIAKTPLVTAADFRTGALRGTNLADVDRGGRPTHDPGDLAELQRLGASLTRVLIPVYRCPGCEHFEFTEAQARAVEDLLAEAGRHGIGLVLTLQPEPAGDKAEYWHNDRLKASIRDVWVRIATRYKASPALAGYDLINEPVPTNARTPAAANRVWVPFAESLIRAIRAVDPERAIVFEPAPWAFPAAFAALEPLPFPNIVYSFHFYHPHELTHQGIGAYALGASYPTRDWNRARLSSELAPVRAFAARHKVAVYAGEFSCIRWAPGDSAARYVRDLIELFSAEGWTWTYHAWRTYHGWDAEVPGEAPRDLSALAAKSRRRADAPVVSILAEMLRRQPPANTRSGAAGAAR